MPAKGEFLLPVRVYYEDTDAGGVVYYANYLKYFERGRTEALRTLGFEQDILMREDDTIFTVRSIQADYLKPVRFNDEVVVKTQIQKMKKASMTFIQTICDLGSDEVLCSLTARVACVTASQMKPRAIPEKIILAMEIASAG